MTISLPGSIASGMSTPLRLSGGLILEVQERRLNLVCQPGEVPLAAVPGGRCGNADDLG